MKNTKGITLIALVVTIVVLLILAGVSLNLVIGNNGIITQGKNAKEAMEQKKVEEAVELAINTLIIENNGSKSGITPKNIADQVKKENSQYKNVYAKNESNFPTQIIFEDENRKVDVSINNNNAIYEADISEEDIARADLFEYEIISDEETGETNGFDSLTTKTARITRLNPKYCNNVDGGYIAEDGKNYADTNYEIILEDGTKITDTLVIPYQVEINGEMYRITEANISALRLKTVEITMSGIPQVKTIIFPNTVEKISGSSTFKNNSSITTVILPQNLKTIGDYMAKDFRALKNITIPESVRTIAKHSFEDCEKLETIAIPDGETTIKIMTFSGCASLDNIKIPRSVTKIEQYAFEYCSNLKTIYYSGTMKEWKEIIINLTGNNYLNNAQIICSDGTIE